MSNWHKVGKVEDVPTNGGACVKIEDAQIAIFNFKARNEWFATQNLCPHRQEMILSRGMIGDTNDEPKVACPYHKRNFSLKTGECLTDEECDSIQTYPVKVEGGEVFVEI